MANVKSSNPDNDNSQKQAEDALFGSTESFFDALDENVNGMVSEDSPVENKEETPKADPQQSTAESGSDNTWKKRYSDSTREAQRMKAELDGLKPYTPVLDAMKTDSGLVEHIRGYFKNGGDVKNLREKLELDKNFRFDTDDLIEDPNSDSRKVFNAMVDGVVEERTTEMTEKQTAERTKEARTKEIHRQAEEFRTKNGFSKEQMGSFLQQAEQRFSKGVLSFDDMYTIINRDNVSNNVAKATKEDMLTQMKNVRTIPTSQGNANSAGEKSHDDDIFDALNSIDGNLDNMFG